MHHAPAAHRFSDAPAAWYLFGPSTKLGAPPTTRTMLGRRLVAFRTNAGKPVVLDAQCAHLGADLGRGCVVGDSIRCPFHGWEYGPDGLCTHAPASPGSPPAARQQAFPAVERHGHLFFFYGAAPTFPLPFFEGEDPQAFVGGRLFRFRADCPWYLLVANGFDMAHMHVVHDRALVGTPVVDCPAPFARRIRYQSRVTGTSIFDRLLRRFVGTQVDVSITNWGGPLTLVSGVFQRARSHLLIAAQPEFPDPGSRGTLVEVLVLGPRPIGPARLLNPVALELRRWFTRGFMHDDLDRIGTVRYRPDAFVEADHFVVDFLHWLVGLHETPPLGDKPGVPREIPVIRQFSPSNGIDIPHGIVSSKENRT